MGEPLERIAYYRLVGRLGKGAMGEVYRAVDERLNREVAIKLLPGRFAASPERQARLLREAQAASALNHPGIVTVHDVGTWQGRFFLVMELLEGETFSKIAPTTPDEALRVVAAAADALGAAHDRGILHRDIKSDNLIRLTDGRVKVLDFGLAKARLVTPDGAGDPAPEEVAGRSAAATLAQAVTLPPRPRDDAFAVSSADTLAPEAAGDGALAQTATPVVSAPGQPTSFPAMAGHVVSTPASSELTMVGSVLGTPAYMSPEQAAGEALDAQSEVFSLGVVLYELLVGHRPFDRATAPETITAVRTAAIVAPSRAAPERHLPPALDDVVLRAVARARADRFPDMRAFAAAARAAIGHGRRRRRVLAAGAALVVLAGGASGAVLMQRSGRLPRVEVTSTRRLTFDPGCEEYPSFTPDGKTLVFDGLIDGDTEILALDLATGTRRRLTHAPSWDCMAAVSPDGTWVAYLHLADDAELNVLPIAGDGQAKPLRLVRHVSSVPAWTPSGALLVADMSGAVLRWERPALTAGGDGMPVAHLPSPLVGRALVALDEHRLVAVVGPPRTNMQGMSIVLIDGPTVTELENDASVRETGLALGPGHALYYGRSNAAHTLDAVMRPDLTHPATVIGSGIAPENGLAVSRDGRRLAYSTCREVDRLARVRKGRPLAPLLPNQEWMDVQPVRLDREHVLFTSDRAGSAQVWISDLAGRRARPIAGPRTMEASASPDGTIIVYRGPAGLELIRRDGETLGAARQLTTAAGDMNPRLTADGTRVLFARPEGAKTAVFVVPAAGGTPARLVDDATWPVASPVDDHIVYFASGGQVPTVGDLSGGPARPLAPDQAPARYRAPARFSPDGQRVLLVRNTHLVEYPLAGGAPDELVVEADNVESADYAPDGDGFIAAVQGWEGDLWLADGTFP